MSGQPKIYLVGRQNKRIPCDIYTPSHEDTVSRPHLELTVTAEGKYYILDLKSASGTYLKKSGQWVRVGQEYVELDAPMRLGEFQTTVRQLLAMRGPEPEPPTPPKPGGRAYFNPETGELEYE